MIRSNPTNTTLVDIVISGLKKFAAAGALTLAALTATDCTSEEAAYYSSWPMPKESRAVQKHYDRHIDDHFFSYGFSSHSESEKRVYDYLRFSSAQIESTYRIGGQAVVRLKRSCGKSNHGPNCYTYSIHGLSRYDWINDQAVLVTLRQRSKNERGTLMYVLERDDTSFLDIEYDLKKDKKEGLKPVLKLRIYQIGSDGRVINPVPSMPGGWDINIRYLEDIAELDRYLKSNFNGASIFTEDDVSLAKYFSDPEGFLGLMKGNAARLHIIKSKESAKPLAERSRLLSDYSRRFRMADINDPERNVELRAEVRIALEEAYKNLHAEHENKAWEASVPRSQRSRQSDEIIRNLRSAAQDLD